MATAFPSGTNTFVPSFDATGHLVVGYSRNPKDFALNKYVTIIPVKRSIGYYLRLTAENAARILSADAHEAVWHDGNDAPAGLHNLESHEFHQYNTLRYAFPFRLGWKAIQQADWKVLAVHSANAAQQAMTARTLLTGSLITTSGNYATGHTDTATNLGGGFWSAGTATNPIIKKTLNKAAQKIQKSTLGVVRPKDLALVISPVVADEMGRSQEVHTFLKESQFALAQVRGDVENQNGVWGLPTHLYGFPIVVEDTVRVTSKKGATLASDYLFDGNKAALIARPGQLVSEGSRSFSTIIIFMFEEMSVESKDDPDNRRTAGRVVEDYAVVMASPISGYLITAVLS
jgi:hypothetical protein